MHFPKKQSNALACDPNGHCREGQRQPVSLAAAEGRTHSQFPVSAEHSKVSYKGPAVCWQELGEVLAGVAMRAVFEFSDSFPGFPSAQPILAPGSSWQGPALPSAITVLGIDSAIQRIKGTVSEFHLFHRCWQCLGPSNIPSGKNGPLHCVLAHELPRRDKHVL